VLAPPGPPGCKVSCKERFYVHAGYCHTARQMRWQCWTQRCLCAALRQLWTHSGPTWHVDFQQHHCRYARAYARPLSGKLPAQPSYCGDLRSWISVCRTGWLDTCWRHHLSSPPSLHAGRAGAPGLSLGCSPAPGNHCQLPWRDAAVHSLFWWWVLCCDQCAIAVVLPSGAGWHSRSVFPIKMVAVPPADLRSVFATALLKDITQQGNGTSQTLPSLQKYGSNADTVPSEN
jgi:hypothetical protein